MQNFIRFESINWIKSCWDSDSYEKSGASKWFTSSPVICRERKQHEWRQHFSWKQCKDPAIFSKRTTKATTGAAKSFIASKIAFEIEDAIEIIILFKDVSLEKLMFMKLWWSIIVLDKNQTRVRQFGISFIWVDSPSYLSLAELIIKSFFHSWLFNLWAHFNYFVIFLL